MFEIDESDDKYVDWVRFDFESMRAKQRWDAMDEPGLLRDRSYALRRRDGGWEWKMTLESWTEHMKWLEKEKASKFINFQMNAQRKATVEEETKKYADGPIWEALPDEYAAPIETAYQRYVRQG